MSNSAKRYRNFCFTVNNYTDSQIKGLDNYNCNYLVYGLEIGKLGTPHIQGYIEFTHPKTISAFNKGLIAKKAVSGLIVNHAMGHLKQASGYCKKGESPDRCDMTPGNEYYFDNPGKNYKGNEFGIISQQGLRTDIKECIDVDF